MEHNIPELVAQLTLEEKAGLCSGADFWHTKTVERLGIPTLMVSDGPHGLRTQDPEQDDPNHSRKAVCFPAGCSAAASFDPDLARREGAAIGQGHLCVVQCDASAPDFQRSTARTVEFGSVCALQNVLHPQQKLLHQEGLGQIVVGSQPQPEQPVGIRIPGRKEEGRDVGLGAQLPEQTEAVAVRQVDVKDHQVGHLPGECDPRLGTAGRRGAVLVSGSVQLVAEQPDEIGIVVHKKKLGLINAVHNPILHCYYNT